MPRFGLPQVERFSDSAERRLNSAQRPSWREGLLWIVDPPFSAGEPVTVDDPEPTASAPPKQSLKSMAAAVQNAATGRLNKIDNGSRRARSTNN
jgi:hypothetical protein